ncbi:hypothetical protein EYF80_042794 [Liparis tanakae]|uniref:Uncharacterized protein n=1 Tax=Liparis tanakae TaxID=230148 RepID=A0A4Z2G2A2_9TELE|nr:hypothetical protein EYF80_042794 [Liparis tanakae]
MASRRWALPFQNEAALLPVSLEPFCYTNIRQQTLLHRPVEFLKFPDLGNVEFPYEVSPDH